MKKTVQYFPLFQINLDSKTRLAVKDNMSSPNKHTFEEAQRKIQGLMEKDSYPRFLNSDAYQKLLREHKVNTWRYKWRSRFQTTDS